LVKPDPNGNRKARKLAEKLSAEATAASACVAEEGSTGLDAEEASRQRRILLALVTLIVGLAVAKLYA